MKPLCIRYLNKNLTEAWCALKPGAKASSDASPDPTACGFYVVDRIGMKRREPDCLECRKILGLPETCPKPL